MKKALLRRGKRKVRIQLTDSPTGNSAVMQFRTAKLVRQAQEVKAPECIDCR